MGALADMHWELGVARREGASPLTRSPLPPSTPAQQSCASRCLDPRALRALAFGSPRERSV